MTHFHHRQFSDLRDLLSRKQAQGETISVCIPTLNEEQTIGSIVETIRSSLMDAIPLVDELFVIDSGSSDATAAVATAAGADFRLASEILPEHGCHHGKGENLWKGLHVSSGSIVCYIDGDISNFHPGFVTGLIGPLLSNPDIEYVKAFYQRPISNGDSFHHHGGGRVSEILVRPLISMFYPALTNVLQPLSGEYAARRPLLRHLPFPTGYGVEIAHLIDLQRMGKLHRLAQTDLETRHHTNRPDSDLGDTAFAILQVVLRRLQRDGLATIHQPLPEHHLRWQLEDETHRPLRQHLPEPERGPISPQK